jgi:hypothetical protein
MKQLSQIIVWAAFMCTAMGTYAQQQVDNDFKPNISHPVFKQGEGPLLLVDAGHHNFHTLADKFAPFGKVAEMNGFKLKSNDGALQAATLAGVKILVIANALNEKNVDNWRQPVLSAFTAAEIDLIKNWVNKGGRLFLIADHMPFAGAAAELARSFGFSFYDGFAMCRPKKKYDAFYFANGTLKHSVLTDMHGAADSIVTFTGQAFNIPPYATPVISLGAEYKVLMPEVAWEFNDQMKIAPAEGLSQLAYGSYGAGKLVVAGEAAMFTAQRVGDVRIGLSAPYAPNNVQLLSNILEWLAK